MSNTPHANPAARTENPQVVSRLNHKGKWGPIGAWGIRGLLRVWHPSPCLTQGQLTALPKLGPTNPSTGPTANSKSLGAEWLSSTALAVRALDGVAWLEPVRLAASKGAR